jgi:hypothetical protein
MSIETATVVVLDDDLEINTIPYAVEAPTVDSPKKDYNTTPLIALIIFWTLASSIYSIGIGTLKYGECDTPIQVWLLTVGAVNMFAKTLLCSRGCIKQQKDNEAGCLFICLQLFIYAWLGYGISLATKDPALLPSTCVINFHTQLVAIVSIYSIVEFGMLITFIRYACKT